MSVDTLDIEPELTDLVVIPTNDALKVFSAERKPGESHPIDPMLAKVRAVIDEFEADVSTSKGRDAIRSFSHRITKAKTALEAVGKELADEQKEIPKRIDATRKFIKDTLDAWRDEVRKPLTDWEEAEEKRTEGIKAKLEAWQTFTTYAGQDPSEWYRVKVEDLQAQEIDPEFFAEFTEAARELKAGAIANLQQQQANAAKREAEAAELEQLRKEKAERDAKEKAEQEALAAKRREDEIARKAEENARKAAEAEAQAKVEAAEKALREEREKIERERREVEAKAKREAEEQAAREADREHRLRVNTAALEAFMRNGIDRDTAVRVMTLIGEGKIPAIKIHY